MILNNSLKKLGVLFILIIILFGFTNKAEASTPDTPDTEVNIYIFWGVGCPHCERAKPALESLADSDPRIGYYDFEVYNSQENLVHFFEIAAEFGFEPTGVPTIFAGERYWVGYSEDILAEIESYVKGCLSTSCADTAGEVLAGETGQEEVPTPTPEWTATPTLPADEESTPSPAGVDADPETSGDSEGDQTINLPLIGRIDLSGQSVLVSTLIISFVDGFNPCSLWVLSILLSITLQSRSRKKVLIVGGVFLLVTSILYGLFIAGVFSVLRVISFMGWIQVVVALIALGFALVNIKDYFWFKEGLSFTISDDKKPGIYKRMRGVLEKGDSTWRMIGATVVFAAGIALVELSCTAGFPVIWSNLLAGQQIETLTFLLLLLVYMIIYLLDEVGIFLGAVFTLRSSKLEEKHGRVLKLIGGMLMFTLAIVMLIDPNIMNDLSGTLIVFGIALGLTGLVLLVHRVLLPRFNIKVGSEK